jgi:hypothetical protein
MRTLKTVLAAALVFGTASMALADDGTDTRLDTSRTGFAPAQVQVQPQFSNRAVALPYQQYRVAPQSQAVTPDIAGANHDNL